MPENNQYFQNYLKLLDLRLLTLLNICPEETRGDAKDYMADALDTAEIKDPGLSDQEVLFCAEMSDMLSKQQDELYAAAKADGKLPRIELLRDRLGLDANEMLLLTAILACNADERFRRIYKLFQNSEEPRMDLLLALIAPDGMDRYRYAELLGPEGKLLSLRLVETVGNVPEPGPLTTYRPAPGLLAWLNGTRSLGYYQDTAEWIEVSHSINNKDGSLVNAAAAIEVAEFEREPVPLVSLFGPDQERLQYAAEALADELERPMLKLDFSGLDDAETIPLLQLALRDAQMNRGVLVMTGLNRWIDSGGIFPARVGRVLEKWAVPVVLLTGRSFVFSPYEMSEKRLLLRLPVEGLSGSQRFDVWKERLTGLDLDEKMNEDELRTLAGQFILNSVQIRAAVNFGLGKAVTEGRNLGITDLYEGARKSSMHHLSDLAKQMTARYTLKDLILPQKQAAEIDALIAMARNRAMVLEDWGVGKKLVSGRGISALFTGVPGTGKTLSAQAIAGELGLELYRVDLSTIVSKYIGETEKNLERVFTEAQNSNVILFFDEADSLFGRRSEVGDSHDRYANIEVGYLLQRIETYDGIVLMATNLGANLDEAFARRIHFIIDFPFPDEETRLRLWQLLLPENIEKESEIDLHPFAAAYKIAGGGIRNAVVWAIYEAARNKRPLSRDDLLHGVEREYQKMGKVFIPIG